MLASTLKLLRPLLLCPYFLACQSAISDARSAFDEARYADAAVAFRKVRSAELAPDERARLNLYSGLTELALGNLALALPKLSAARAWAELYPDDLSPSEKGRLLSAWDAIGRMPGESLQR